MTDSVDKSISAHERGEHLFCAYCGTEDKTDYGYCDHCGERVAAPDSVRFSSRELGKCQTCSADNQLHARHCVGCGVSFEDTPLVQVGGGPMDPSPRDAAYPDPSEPEGSHSPSRVSTAEPKERQDDHRAPPYARPERSRSRRERLDSWSSSDARGADGGPNADEFDGREYDPAARQDDGEVNDSGTREAQLPTELKGYNWGALFLGPVWGVGNRTWIATVLFAFWIVPIPPAIGLPLYIFGSLYLGSQANRWAWQSKKWMNIHHFKRVQQNWTFWGFIISPIIIFSLTLPLWSSGS